MVKQLGYCPKGTTIFPMILFSKVGKLECLVRVCQIHVPFKGWVCNTSPGAQHDDDSPCFVMFIFRTFISELCCFLFYKNLWDGLHPFLFWVLP